MKKKFWGRVDVQVTIFVVSMLAVSSIIISSLEFSMSYTEMIKVLESNAYAIEEYIDENIDPDIFTHITTKEDMMGEQYDKAYAMLNEVRLITGAKYLYTATENEKGELIYHVDALPHDDVDFRYVGDLIEPEFQAPLFTALCDIPVLPNEIMTTAWGDVYVVYFPLHDNYGNVIAALGIEFPADSQHEAYQKVIWRSTIAIVLICIIVGFVSHALFKRISNPHFKDIYNTDSLTKLKNRNAFDTDVHNNIEKNAINGSRLVITDLNGLKNVNDQFGHKMGDFYIEACAKALVVDGFEEFIVYRIGGDEFATIIPANCNADVDSYIKLVKEKLERICKDKIDTASASMGYAVCEGDNLEDWECAQSGADAKMYVDKRAFYEKNKQLDSRKS